MSYPTDAVILQYFTVLHYSVRVTASFLSKLLTFESGLNIKKKYDGKLTAEKNREDQQLNPDEPDQRHISSEKKIIKQQTNLLHKNTHI